MEPFIAATISTRNLIGEPEKAIRNMEIWLQKAADQGAELILFPELNVSGDITAPGPLSESMNALLLIAF